MRLNIFGIYQKKERKFCFYFYILKGKNFFPSHSSLMLLSSARFGGIILGVNTACTYKMVYNVILREG